MAFDFQTFDAAAVDPVSFDVLPEGKYLACIEASEVKPTKAGDGERLNLTFVILDGPHKGRKLWEGLNIDNPSEKAQGIARGQLSAICRAVGVLRPSSSAALHDRALCIKVVCKKREDNGDMKNEIKGFYPASELNAASAPAVAPPPAVGASPFGPPPV